MEQLCLVSVSDRSYVEDRNSWMSFVPSGNTWGRLLPEVTEWADQSWPVVNQTLTTRLALKDHLQTRGQSELRWLKVGQGEHELLCLCFRSRTHWFCLWTLATEAVMMKRVGMILLCWVTDAAIRVGMGERTRPQLRDRFVHEHHRWIFLYPGDLMNSVDEPSCCCC